MRIHLVCLSFFALCLLGASTLLAQDVPADPRDAPETEEVGEGAEEGRGEQSGTPEDSEAATQTARELFLRGDRLYARGQYDEAVIAFREAYELSGRPELKFNLANAYERLNRMEEAAAALREYAPYASDIDRPVVQERIEAIEARLEEDDAAAAARRGGSSAPAPRAAPAGSEPSLTGPVILISVGAAGAIGATVLAVLSLGPSSDADDACGEFAGDTFCPGSAQGDVDDASTFALAADITGAVSGVAMAAGLAWLVGQLSLSGEDSTGVALDFGVTPTTVAGRAAVNF